MTKGQESGKTNKTGAILLIMFIVGLVVYIYLSFAYGEAKVKVANKGAYSSPFSGKKNDNSAPGFTSEPDANEGPEYEETRDLRKKKRKVDKVAFKDELPIIMYVIILSIILLCLVSVIVIVIISNLKK